MKLKTLLTNNSKTCKHLKMKACFLARLLPSQKFLHNHNLSKTSKTNFPSKFWLLTITAKAKMFWIWFLNKIKKWKTKVLVKGHKIQSILSVITKKKKPKTLKWSINRKIHKIQNLLLLKKLNLLRLRTKSAILIDKLQKLKKQLLFNKKLQIVNSTSKPRKSKKKKNKLKEKRLQLRLLNRRGLLPQRLLLQLNMLVKRQKLKQRQKQQLLKLQE